MNPRANLDGKVIAIVDDHEVLRHSMQGLLEAYGGKFWLTKAAMLSSGISPLLIASLSTIICPIHGVQLASELRSRGLRRAGDPAHRNEQRGTETLGSIGGQ